MEGFTYLGMLTLGQFQVPVSTCDRCRAMIIGADSLNLRPGDHPMIWDMRPEHAAFHSLTTDHTGSTVGS